MTEITPPTSIRIGDTQHGRGVIATKDIAKGETIEVCPVLELTSDEANGVLTDYIVGLGDEVDGSALMLGYGSLYNHAEDPNAEYLHETDDVYSFVATRDIAAGEEVTISYGKEWWTSRADGDDAA
jgi:SET domain-containing protein